MGNSKAKNGGGDSQLADTPASSAQQELTQLRDILFGQAQQQLTERIDMVEKQLAEQVATLTDSIEKGFATLNASLRETEKALSQQITQTDTKQDDNYTQLMKITDGLQSSLEMAESAAKSDTQSLENHMVQEMDKLDAQIAANIGQLQEKLSKVTSELSNTKTDRKTLAELLATMATNLVTDKS